MRKIILSLFLLFILIINSYAHKDHAFVKLDSLQNQSLKSSGLIFLGKLVGVDTVNFAISFYILEEFKGHLHSKTINVICEKNDLRSFIDKSLWLVYVNQNVDSTFILNSNGLTRSIIHPENIPSYQLPPPPPLKYEIQAITDFTQNWVDFKTNALRDWYTELEQLRDFKKSRIKTIKDNEFEIKIYFYFSIVMNIICISLITLIMFKKKHTE